MVIAIANDHSAIEFKMELVEYIKSLGHDVLNLGTDTTLSVDYPQYAKKVATALLDKKADFGVIICGTGIGISIAANKVKGIRAALVENEYCARLSREHNDANIIAFGARVIGIELAKSCLKVFLETQFEGGRHQRRVNMLDCGGCDEYDI